MALVLPTYLAGMALFSIGIIVSLNGVLRFFSKGMPEPGLAPDQKEDSPVPTSKVSRSDLIVTGLAAVVLCAGVLLRVHGLGTKSISHPEVYAPGIELPADISEPPPRLVLPRVVWWHFHNESHPQAYYLMMWGWTKVFGTSLFALRLPSVLFGSLSLALVFYVAAEVYGRATGLAAMSLLAFNGHHIYWSQMARMYAMVCFLGLLSTFLLLKLTQSTKRRAKLEVLYVAVSLLGVMTEIYFWPFLAAQMLWAATCMRKTGSNVSRIILLQTLVVILGAPMWAHAIYLSNTSHLQGPSLTLLGEYLSFGFAHERDGFSLPPRQLPALLLLSSTLFALLLIARGSTGSADRPASVDRVVALDPRKLLPAIPGAMMLILGMAMLASKRQYLMMAAGFIPLIALLMPSALSRVSSLRKTLVFKRMNVFAEGQSLLFFLAFVPALLVVGISFVFPLLASRLFLLFTPFLLILIASGVRNYCRKLASALPVCALLVVLSVSSMAYFKATPSDSRDYKELAQQIMANIEEPDLIFVPRKSWTTTPIFYHMTEATSRFVAEGLQAAVDRNPNSRVWLVLFGEQQPTEQMRAALSGFTTEQTISARRGRALLFVRNGGANDNGHGN